MTDSIKAPPRIISVSDPSGVELPPGTITDYRNVAVIGAAGPNEKLAIYDRSALVGETIVNEWGRFDALIVNLASGPHEIMFQSPQGEQSTTWNFFVDTTKYPLLDLVRSPDRVVGDNENVRGDCLAFWGRALDKQPLKLMDGGVPRATFDADARGNWRVLLANIESGPHVFNVETSDGKTSVTRSLSVTVSTGWPDFFIESAVAANGEKVPHGGVTTQRTLTLRGKARPGETGKIYMQSLELGRFNADLQGDWSLLITQLNAAVYFFLAISDFERQTTEFAVDIKEEHA